MIIQGMSSFYRQFAVCFNYFRGHLILAGLVWISADSVYSETASPPVENKSFHETCVSTLKQLDAKGSGIDVSILCDHALVLDNDCRSEEGRPIYHFESKSNRGDAKRILVFGAIHGDEKDSAVIAARWIWRLRDLDSRNSWTIVPLANPDGVLLNHRMNGRGVDLNRNFPSKDWASAALKHWKDDRKSDPRRYPGTEAASESETRCMVRHIEMAKPNFIIAVHTPYGVLDFDGPTVDFPNYRYFPWVSLGTFPGSLGRLMWKDRGVPVLTIELKDHKILNDWSEVDRLQDAVGTLALRAHNKITKDREAAQNKLSQKEQDKDLKSGI